MKKVKTVMLVLLISVIIHIIVLNFLPYIIFSAAHYMISHKTGGLNRIIHAQPATAGNDPVVNSSPDLLYSACAYDVSEKPLLVEALIPESYWSMSGYDSGTDNFFVINNKSAKSQNKIRVIITGVQSGHKAPEDEKRIMSPTPKGIIIFRVLVPTENRLKKLREIQTAASCSQLVK